MSEEQREELEPTGALAYLCRQLDDGSCEFMLPEVPGVFIRAPSIPAFVQCCAQIAVMMTGGHWVPDRLEVEDRDLPSAGEG